jgi:cytochrome b561
MEVIMLVNTKNSYGSVAKFFHWVIAFLMLGMLLLGYFMAGQTVVDIHKLTGLFILSLVSCRLIWKLLNASPQLPDTVSGLEKFAAKSVQALLYVCMFGMPLSGWAMATAFGFAPHLGTIAIPMPTIAIDQAQADLFQFIHNTLAYVLIALIGLHLLGALKHQFMDKDPRVLNSMLPKFKRL